MTTVHHFFVSCTSRTNTCDGGYRWNKAQTKLIRPRVQKIMRERVNEQNYKIKDNYHMS